MTPRLHLLACLLLLFTACDDVEDMGDAPPVDATSDADAPRSFEASGALAIDIDEDRWRQLQHYMSLPEVMPLDPTSAVSGSPEAAALGESLFFDGRLSARGDVSCGTCHDPALGWGDGLATAVAVGQGSRNSPTLFNVASQRWFFWDGRADSLWSQALGPIENPIEMDSTRTAVARLITSDPNLSAAYVAAFGAAPDLSDDARFPPNARPVPANGDDPRHQAWIGMGEADREAVNRVFVNAGKALGEFERSIVSRDSDFDRFLQGLDDGDETLIASLSPSAQRGMALFMGDANCHFCHLGPWFTNSEFHNIGLASPPGPLPDAGRTVGVEQVLQDPFNGIGAWSDAPDDPVNDHLRLLNRDPFQTDGAFKTPALRSVALTAPYMHDGRFETLAEVLAFYNTLPEEPSIGHREDSLQPLELTDAELLDLEAFLISLTGR